MSELSAYRALLTKVQNQYREPIKQALHGQMIFFADKYRKNPFTPVMDLPDAQISRVIKTLYRSCGLASATMEAKNIKKKANRKAAEPDQQTRWDVIIQEYYNQFLLQKIVNPITETTEKVIKRVLLEALQQGWGIDQTVRALKDTELNEARAELIVRTESMRAANAGAMVAAATAGLYMRKEWISTDDDRTRVIPRDDYDHLHMNGKQVEFTEAFIVPSLKTVDAMQFPGDPAGSAGNVCNCRCKVAFIPQRDATGRLITINENSPINSNIFLTLSRRVDELMLQRQNNP